MFRQKHWGGGGGQHCDPTEKDTAKPKERKKDEKKAIEGKGYANLKNL